jgi:ATP-dependent Lon protease
MEKYKVPYEKLRLWINEKDLKFSSTKDLACCQDIVGQQRAVEALKLGLEIKASGYNIFVTGPVGTGRTTTVKYLLETLEKSMETPNDKCYVNNFKNPDQPRLITLPAGMGRVFKNSMDELIEYLKRNIPLVLESDAYQKKRQLIIDEFKEKSNRMVLEFEKKVSKEGFALQQPAPMVKPEIVYLVENNPVKISDLLFAVEEGKMSRQEYETIKEKAQALTDELNTLFKEIRNLEKETREKLANLDRETVKPILEERLNEIKEKLKNEKVNEYLKEVEQAILDDITIFKKEKKEEEAPFPFIRDIVSADPYLEFRVNLLVDNAEEVGAPIIFENTPTFKNLFGTIEKVWDARGQWRTDFTKIKAGSLVKADGGFLVLNALDVLLEGTWYALKRCLRIRKVDITAYDPYSLFGVTALKPEPIDINVKVIMIGDAFLYTLLATYDEDFKKIFKVRADFDWTMNLEEETIREYANVVRTIVEKENLKHFSASAIAKLVEYGIRLGGRKNKLSTRFGIITDILKEASYWAEKDNSELVLAKHITKAIEMRDYRVKLIEEKIQEMIDEGLLLIDTEGKVVGQINGLSIYDTGEYFFGRPTRITAKVAVGTKGIINIEREAQLSGKIHDKGVLILSGYLMSKYAQEFPIVMNASICFEQSYGGVEGDSASSAELFALISAIGNIPLRQDIAVTGSVNQKGEIQAIGGVNEKIEGFFEVCKKRGLTGTQGVIIPESNVDDLMLKEEVCEAVKKGLFHIYAIRNVDEGLEILTEMKAEEVHKIVKARLKELAENYKKFTAKEEKE